VANVERRGTNTKGLRPTVLEPPPPKLLKQGRSEKKKKNHRGTGPKKKTASLLGGEKKHRSQVNQECCPIDTMLGGET